jgi:hypothetical protein
MTITIAMITFLAITLTSNDNNFDVDKMNLLGVD